MTALRHIAALACLVCAAPALADGWDRTADFRIGKHDFGGYTSQDISFYPRYWSLDACKVSVPVDRARWTNTTETKSSGWPRQRTKFEASEKLGSYKNRMDKLLHNPSVTVTYACGPSGKSPKAKLDDFRSRNRGGSTYKVEWGPVQRLNHPTFGPVYFAPRAVVYQSGNRQSGVSAYFNGPDGQLIGMRTSIDEMNTSKHLSRPMAWNVSFSTALLEAIKVAK